MHGPAPIEFSLLGVGQLEAPRTLCIRKAFPQGDGEFRPIPGGEFQELRKRAGCHEPIVSRVNTGPQYPREIARSSLPPNVVDCISSCVQRSHVTTELRRALFTRRPAPVDVRQRAATYK